MNTVAILTWICFAPRLVNPLTYYEVRVYKNANTCLKELPRYQESASNCKPGSIAQCELRTIRK